MQLLTVLCFLGFLACLAVSPKEIAQLALAAAWVILGASALASVAWSVGRVFLS